MDSISPDLKSSNLQADPVARFWGQRGVRPHSGTQAAQSDGKTDPDQRLPRTSVLRLAHAWLTQRSLARRDHNSQNAPRSRHRLGPVFCASAHAQTQSAAPLVPGLRFPEGSATSLPPRPRWLRVSAGAAGLAAFLKNAWAKEPVLVASFTIAGLAIILPILSPYTKYSIMINKATPYTYPVPLRDDGNMPDVPSHPQDPQGPSLEWLKKL
uniref:NADH dehydrogenase [ubiquinone] 1 alpha subcomplex subunit 3 n=1 Tax=Equus caballus TaxID=9796 RepID=A0A9L0R9A4_HORSE